MQRWKASWKPRVKSRKPKNLGCKKLKAESWKKWTNEKVEKPKVLSLMEKPKVLSLMEKPKAKSGSLIIQLFGSEGGVPETYQSLAEMNALWKKICFLTGTDGTEDQPYISCSSGLQCTVHSLPSFNIAFCSFKNQMLFVCSFMR